MVRTRFHTCAKSSILMCLSTLLVMALAGCGQPDTLASQSQSYPPPPPTQALWPTQPVLPTAPVVPIVSDSPLLNASPAEVGRAALEFTQQNSRVLKGKPKVVLARQLSVDEIPLLGVESLGFDASSAPPMMVVIIKGDFDISSIPAPVKQRDKVKTHVKYIGYIYDLRAGMPILTAPSLNGGKFRKILKDPSISEDPTLVPETPMSVDVNVLATPTNEVQIISDSPIEVAPDAPATPTIESTSP